MLSEEIFFWASVLLLSYTYLGYPALMYAWAALRGRPHRKQRIQPTVSVVAVAHNEATRVAQRLENLLSLDYPRCQLEILFASDGSTDDTVERARAYEPKGIRVIAFNRRRGKPAVLNDIVPEARGDVVVLADVRQRFEPGALRALVAPFADVQVGAVSGELILNQNAKGTSVGEGIGFYWRYEKFMRRSESQVDSAVGATGAIYAIRRELFRPVPEDTILDDVVIPIRIARQGYRVLFEPDARAYDGAAATAAEEFTRKVRTITGNFQLFAREGWILNPFRNRLWLQTVSHKGFRLLTPVLLSGAFAANLLLLGLPFYRLAFAGQVVFYAAALGGHALRNAKRKIPLFSFPYVLCLLSWATVVAFFRFVTGSQAVTWEQASSRQARRGYALGRRTS